MAMSRKTVVAEVRRAVEGMASVVRREMMAREVMGGRLQREPLSRMPNLLRLQEVLCKSLLICLFARGFATSPQQAINN